MKSIHIVVTVFACLFVSALNAQAQTPVNIRQVGDVSIGATVPVSGTVTTTLCTSATCSEVVISVPTSTAGNAVTMVATSGYAASVIAKASPGNLYGLFGYNSKSSAQWVQCGNSATLPADTATPLITFTVPATSNFSLSIGQFPANFSAGITCWNSSTGPTKTIGSADTWFNVLVN